MDKTADVADGPSSIEIEQALSESEGVVESKTKKRGRPRKYKRGLREKWGMDIGNSDWLMQSAEGTIYCKICKVNLTAKKSHIAQHERSAKHRKNADYVSTVLSHLDIEEQSQLCDFVYLSLLGEQAYRKWKNMKRSLGFAKERDFMMFLLNTAQEKIEEEETREKSSRAQKVTVRVSTDKEDSEVIEKEVHMHRERSVDNEEDEYLEDDEFRSDLNSDLMRNRRKLFACKYCKKIFVVKEQVVSHIKSVHLRSDGSVGASAANVRNSTATKTARDRYKYKCSICLKEFKYKAAASKHMEECKQLADVREGAILCINENGDIVSEGEMLLELESEARFKRARRTSPPPGAVAATVAGGSDAALGGGGGTVLLMTQQNGNTVVYTQQTTAVHAEEQSET